MIRRFNLHLDTCANLLSYPFPLITPSADQFGVGMTHLEIKSLWQAKYTHLGYPIYNNMYTMSCLPSISSTKYTVPPSSGNLLIQDQPAYSSNIPSCVFWKRRWLAKLDLNAWSHKCAVLQSSIDKLQPLHARYELHTSGVPDAVHLWLGDPTDTCNAVWYQNSSL